MSEDGYYLQEFQHGSYISITQQTIERYLRDNNCLVYGKCNRSSVGLEHLTFNQGVMSSSLTDCTHDVLN